LCDLPSCISVLVKNLKDCLTYHPRYIVSVSTYFFLLRNDTKCELQKLPGDVA
jgi:hypothetical protein